MAYVYRPLVGAAARVPPIVKYPEALAQIMKSLGREIEAIKGRTLNALVEASEIIRKDMDVTIPLVPIKTGNLKRSWFCVASTGTVRKGRNPRFVPEIEKGRPTASGARKAARLAEEHGDLLETLSGKAKEIGAERGPAVIFGYSAFYAAIVHEKYGEEFGLENVRPELRAKFGQNLLGAIPTWTRKGSGPKFLQASVARNRNAILKLIRENIRRPRNASFLKYME